MLNCHIVLYFYDMYCLLLNCKRVFGGVKLLCSIMVQPVICCERVVYIYICDGFTSYLWLN